MINIRLPHSFAALLGLTNAPHVVIKGLTFLGSLGDALRITGGEHDLVAAIEGFPPIPFNQIGLQTDEYRKTIPPRDMKLLKEGDTAKRKFSSSTDIEASNKK